MNDPIEFVKLSGSGNDFILIDNRDGRLDWLVDSGQVGHFVRTLCRRARAVGADGVIFAEKTDLLPDVTVFAHHFEPDGSEAELCGNGAACFVAWLTSSLGREDQEIKVLTSAGVIRGRRIDERYVRVCIPLPSDMARDIELLTEGRRWKCDFLVAGVPHAVTYVCDVDAVDVGHWGPLIRHHEHFRPRGANANFVQVIAPGRLALRTFEFGVENETLACGTGSAAAAILAATRFGWPKEYLTGEKPVEIRARSGDWLRVFFALDADGNVNDLCLETVVRRTYTARLSEELAAEATGQ